MDSETLLADLRSGDYDRVISALFSLGSEREELPSEDVFAQILILIESSDTDIRHRAIFVAGIHWHYADAFSRILGVLDRTDEDTLVLTCAANAIGSMARQREELRETGLRKLAEVALNPEMAQEARDVAYLSALRAANRISPDEYARFSISTMPVEMDLTWLNSIR